MLTGRESLIRLVGKRRYFLPNAQSLFSSSPPLLQTCRSSSSHQNGEYVSLVNEVGSSESNVKDVEEDANCPNISEESKLELVTCPVCGNRVQGGNYMINSHLDTCLARGSKRKLAQRTLLQLNFRPRTTVQVCSNVSDPSIRKVVSTDPDGRLMEESGHGGHNINVDNEGLDGLVLNDFSDILKSDDRVDLPSSCFVEAPSVGVKMNMNWDDISGLVLNTCIVGRKFSNEKELIVGMKVSLLREPDNVKDSNAVKVLPAHFGPSKLLGYLPRGLAQYVSPLMGKFCFSFEGSITVVPERSLDVVPIQLSCPQMVAHLKEESDYAEDLKYLWRNALHEAHRNPPSLTRYQKNFCVLIHEVLTSCPHLFTDDEKLFMESFTALSDDSQRLFIRLYSRKGPWFRMSNISYPEISDLQQAVNELSETGYIIPFDSMEVDANSMKDILRKLTLSELREIVCLMKKNGNRGTRKEELISSLLSFYVDGSCSSLPSKVLEKAGACIRMSSKAESLFWRSERLFFLNGEQDLSAFLLVDLGIVKYPAYNCIISDKIFPTRTELLAYEEAIELAQLMDQYLDENDSEKILRCIKIADSCIDLPSGNGLQCTTCLSSAAFLSCFTAPWIYSKVVLLGVSFLERERRYSDAIILLRRLLDCFTCDGRRGYWTVRLSIDLEHLGYVNDSLSVAESGLLDPWVRAGSRMTLQKRIIRLAKPPRRWKVPTFPESKKRKITEVQLVGRPLNCEMGKKNRFYGEDGEQCGVEQLALQHYAGEGGGWHGVHTESGIWLTIFGLLMWDVIFTDVPNVFRTRFQMAPLDLETDSFYPARKSLIESFLQRIHDEEAEEMIIQSWESHKGTACRGVNWERHSLPELRAAVSCIGGPCLASLCRHLSQDYRSWSSGMPDLLLWRFNGEYRGEAKLVEVKGPKDRLSEQQRAWLLLLMDMGFNTEVCKVTPPPV